MSLNLSNLNEEQAAKVLFDGMIHGVRHKLKEQLMHSLEKDVDAHIETVLKQIFKMEVYKDYATDVLNIAVIKKP